MSQYILLIYGDEAAGNERFAQMSEEEQQADMGRWWAYTQELEQAGAHVAGEALHPTETAQTVTVENGEYVVVTREVISGPPPGTVTFDDRDSGSIQHCTG